MRSGLVGDVSDEAFLALIAGRDPGLPERDLGRGFVEGSVRGFDAPLDRR